MNINSAEKLITTIMDQIDQLPDQWTRKRIQSPRTVLATLLVLALDRGVTNIRTALARVHHLFPERQRRREPSPAAFSRMRLRLDDAYLRDIFFRLTELHCQSKPIDGYRVNGFQFLAMDGTQLCVPRTTQTVEEFGVYTHRNPSHQPQSRLVATWDVYGRRPIDWVAGECFHSERSAALAMIEKLPAQSVVLLDRGFMGFDVFHAFYQSKVPFFARVKSSKTGWLAVQEFVKKGRSDGLVTIAHPKQKQSLTLRLVVTKRANKKSGKTDVFAFLTTLTDTKIWPKKLLMKLYSSRWDIETAFREMKLQDHVEHFHAKTAIGIRQEIAAYMIARLLVGMTTNMAIKNHDPTADGTDPHRRLYNNITATHATIAWLLDAWNIHATAAQDCLDHWLVLMRDSMQRRRPNRSYERKCKGRFGRWKGTRNHRSGKGRNSQLA